MTPKKQAQMPADDERQDVLMQIGNYLRETRQNRGEDLYDIAEYLRIRPSYLFAIEEGDLSMTPGATYAVGFMRSYSNYLGADTNLVINEARYALNGALDEPVARKVVPEPEPEPRRPSIRVVALSAAAALALIVVWQVNQSDGLLPKNLTEWRAGIAETVSTYLDPSSDGPSRLSSAEVASVERAPVTTPSAALLPDPQLGQPQPGDQGQTWEPYRIDSSSAIAAERIEERSQPPVAARSAVDLLLTLQARDDGPVQQAALKNNSEASDSRVTLIAVEETWIQVRSATRDYVRTRTLLAGEYFALPNREDLSLWTGNAGGLQIVVDGETLGSPGTQRQVIKELPLAPVTLQEQFKS